MSAHVRRLDASAFPSEQLSAWVDASNGRSDAQAVEGESAAPAEWFVAYTNPKREEMAADSLKRRAFGAYLPVMTVSRGQGRRRRVIRSPLMPRYLFVGIKPGQHLAGLHGTPGLECLVRMAGKPVTVEERIIGGLRSAEASGVYDFTDATEAERDEARRAEAARAFKPGLKVNILAGPFTGLTGLVDGPLPGGRIAILVKLFGKHSSVPMMLADVEMAGEGVPPGVGGGSKVYGRQR